MGIHLVNGFGHFVLGLKQNTECIKMLEEKAEDDDEYVPIYILQINEDIYSMFEECITDMIIDK